MGLLLLLKACGVHHLKHILLGVSPPFLLLISKAIDLCIYKLLIARDSHELVGCRLGGNIRLYFYFTLWLVPRRTNGCTSTLQTLTTDLRAQLTLTST